MGNVRALHVTAAVGIATVVAATGCGGGTSAGGPVGDAGGTSSGSISGTSEDWVQAICKPGKFMDGIQTVSGPFVGATGGGTCVGPQAGPGPVYVTQWDSNFKMRNAMAMLRMCYASAIESGGVIDTFSVNGRNTAALAPLAHFGFSTSC